MVAPGKTVVAAAIKAPAEARAAHAMAVAASARAKARVEAAATAPLQRNASANAHVDGLLAGATSALPAPPCWFKHGAGNKKPGLGRVFCSSSP